MFQAFQSIESGSGIVRKKMLGIVAIALFFEYFQDNNPNQLSKLWQFLNR